MLDIRYSAKFKKDFKRCQKRNYDLLLLFNVINILKIPEKLPKEYRDHILSGQYKGYSECHISPNWLLIYKITDTELWLGRTGTHSDLFDM